MLQREALVVDDHPTNRLLACTLLRKMGWTAQEAENGEAALLLSKQYQFDLILLDISMPGISGEETCARLRQAHAGRALRIIAYTAHAYPEDRERFLACGFNDILVKPIRRQLLEELLGAA